LNAQQQQTQKQANNKKEFEAAQQNGVNQAQFDANSVTAATPNAQQQSQQNGVNGQQQQAQIVHNLTNQQIITLQHRGYTVSQNGGVPGQYVIVPPIGSMQMTQNGAAQSVSQQQQQQQQAKQQQIPQSFGLSHQQQLSAQGQSAFGNPQTMFIQPQQYQTMFIQPQYIQQQQQQQAVQQKNTNASNGQY